MSSYILPHKFHSHIEPHPPRVYVHTWALCAHGVCVGYDVGAWALLVTCSKREKMGRKIQTSDIFAMCLCVICMIHVFFGQDSEHFLFSRLIFAMWLWWWGPLLYIVLHHSAIGVFSLRCFWYYSQNIIAARQCIFFVSSGEWPMCTLWFHHSFGHAECATRKYRVQYFD